MSVYSELWALLRPETGPEPEALTGRVAAVAPLRLQVGDTVLDRGLYIPAGMTFREERDLGREVALLPCEEGFLILCFVERGTAA